MRSFSRRAFLPLLACLLALLAAGCREQTPQLSPLAPAARVLAFGDSLTFGTGAEEDESYPARLEELIRRPVLNAGVPGEVTAEGLTRLPQLLERYRPALLILCHGGNDLLRRTGEERAAENLRRMVSLAKEQGVDVVLLGVPRPDLGLAPPDYYARIAEELAIPYDGKALTDILGDRSLKSDYIHPNAAGYQQLAVAVAELLKSARAL